MKIIVANWKMNKGFDEIDEWLDRFYEMVSGNIEKIQSSRLIICPSAIFLDYLDSELISEGLSHIEEIAKKEGKNAQDFSPEEVNEYVMDSRLIRLGAQDCHFAKEGAYTGEISAKMLRQVGCEYVIIGHSERRIGNQENSELVAKKLAAVIEENLIPILCVGEPIEARNSLQHLQFVKDQIAASIPNLETKIPILLIAYEPIWAIGSGQTATVGQIHEMTNAIFRLFNSGDLAGKVEQLFLLYGGSVGPENSKEILELENVDGLLVGKMSLDAEAFVNLALSSQDWTQNQAGNKQTISDNSTVN